MVSNGCDAFEIDVYLLEMQDQSMTYLVLRVATAIRWISTSEPVGFYLVFANVRGCEIVSIDE